MSGRKSIIYWDAAIFIAWFTDESHRTPEEKEGIEAFVRLAMGGDITLMTSTLTRVEVLDGKIHKEKSPGKLKTPDAIHLATAALYGAAEMHTFDDGLVKKDGHVPDHDLRIRAPTAFAAREIADSHRQSKDENPNQLSLPE